MAIIKCKMCGGSLEISEDMSVAECEYCGTKQTVPKVDDEKKLKLFERANRLRAACEFDKAAGVYESIIADFDTEAEAYWGLILCKFGIEYVDDPATGNKVPTCHRSSFEPVMDDPNYELVLENADAYSRRVYRDEAKAIEELRKGIIEVSSKEEPYDVFISYKELTDSGERTIDSVIAQDIYKELTGEGYRVFFSRISLEDKLGVEYEPYIFAALNSAKVMLVVGTDFDYFNAVWVKNEWSRFLMLMAKGEKKTLIPCFKGIDAYDMPKEFNKLAAQDMGKVGAMQDLVRGVGKIVGGKKEEAPVQNTAVTSGPQASSLLERGFMFLEDEEWKSAEEYFDKVLDIEPKNGEAYFGKLMVEMKTSWDGEISAREYAANSKNFKRFAQFGTDARKSELEVFFTECIEIERKKSISKLLIGGAVIENNVFVKLKSKDMEIVYIPDGVTNIGYGAFYGCKALTEVHIPDSVTSIGANAFCGCEALTEIHIPDGVTNIGDYAFYGCEALTEIHIPDGVTSVGAKAFYECEALTEVYIPNSVTSIGDAAFYGCKALTEIHIPDSMTSIGDAAFYGCEALTEVYIPDSVTSIGVRAFYGCDGLADSDGFVIIRDVLYDYCGDRNSVTIPSGVTSIGDAAFYGCEALTEVHIQDSVTSIGDEAFRGCDGLADSDGFVIIRDVLYDYCGDRSSVTIPDSVTNIGYGAFEDCKTLTEVYIPNSVTSIGDAAFYGCKATIISQRDSCAENYARSYNIKFDRFISEEERIAAAKKAEEERIAAAKRAEEKRIAAEKATAARIAELTAEKEALTAELQTLGIFKASRRREIEARLAAIEKELSKLGGGE